MTAPNSPLPSPGGGEDEKLLSEHSLGSEDGLGEVEEENEEDD